MSLPFETLKLTLQQNLETVFHPMKPKFLDEAFIKQDKRVQRFCALARKIWAAIANLPLTENLKEKGENVLGSSARLLAHLKLVDLLETAGLNHSPEAGTYISYVENAAKSCFKILAKDLANQRPLVSAYVKDPIRIEIDIKEGWTEAVLLPSSKEAVKAKEDVYSHPFALCFAEGALRAYMPLEGAQRVKDPNGPIYREIKDTLNKEYIYEAEKHLLPYPHSSEFGEIFSSLMEPREVHELEQMIVGQTRFEETLRMMDEDHKSREDKARGVVESITGEKAKAMEDRAVEQVAQVIKRVVIERKVVYFEFLGNRLIKVTDHYPIDILVTEQLKKKQIEEVRDEIVKLAMNNPLSRAKPINYPRLSYFAIRMEENNILKAQYADEYMEGKHPLLQTLAKLLRIGIERRIRELQEKIQREKETLELKGLLQELF